MGAVALPLAIIGTGLSLVGTLTGAAGQATQGVSQQQQYESSARASEFNAEVAQRNAGIQRTQTAADIERTRRENFIRAGAARASAGALGGLTGSSLDLISSIAAEQELDVLNIKQQGQLREDALLQGAQLDIFEAKGARVAGESAVAASKVAAASTVLGGLGKAAKTGMTYGMLS